MPIQVVDVGVNAMNVEQLESSACVDVWERLCDALSAFLGDLPSSGALVPTSSTMSSKDSMAPFTECLLELETLQIRIVQFIYMKLLPRSQLSSSRVKVSMSHPIYVWGGCLN